MLRNPLILSVSALVLAGCMNQSQIQSKYVAQQNLCRTDVAQFVASRNAPADAASAQAAGSYFSECMNKAGWRVSMPKPGPVATGPAPNPPSGSPSTNPIASAAAPVPQQQVVTAPPPVTTYPVSPPSGAPSTAPSAAAARYMPARPATVQAAPFGTGGGRQF